MHAIPLAWALLLQIGYNAQQFAGPLLLKKITTFLTNSTYIQPVRSASKALWFPSDYLAVFAHCLHLLQGVPQPDVNINYLWAGLMFVCPLIGAVLYVHSSRLSIIVQIKMRAELTAAVYRKALALSSR